MLALVGGVILVARAPALSGLRQYRVPGEHLLHRDRDQHRPRRAAAAADTRPGPARPDLPRPRPDLAGPGLTHHDLTRPDLAGPDLTHPPGALWRRGAS